MVEQLTAEGTEHGDAYRAHEARVKLIGDDLRTWSR
jgi:hypothetical protein